MVVQKAKGRFWRVHFVSALLRFALKTPESFKGAETKRTLHKRPFGRPFPRTTPSPLRGVLPDFLDLQWGVAKGSGSPCHGSRSSTEMKIQDACCQMGGREVARRQNRFFLQENEWSRSYRVINFSSPKPVQGAFKEPF